jgi:hypothetical protein
MSAVDEAVRRVLRVKFALGLFEHPYSFCRGPPLHESTISFASSPRGPISAIFFASAEKGKHGIILQQRKRLFHSLAHHRPMLRHRAVTSAPRA